MNTTDINFNFKIKVHQNNADRKINKLVGVSGLVNLVGEEIAEKFIERAFASGNDKTVCRHRRFQGLKVTFYAH